MTTGDLYAALDIGGTKIAAALVDGNGTVRLRARTATPAGGGAAVLAAAAAALVPSAAVVPAAPPVLAVAPGPAVDVSAREREALEGGVHDAAVRGAGAVGDDGLALRVDEQVDEVVAHHDVLPQRHGAGLGDDHRGRAPHLVEPRAELLGVGDCGAQ